MTSNHPFFEANKKLWNYRAQAHKDSEFYHLDSFRHGESSLNNLEKEEIGDVANKSLLHLQCHFGLDTLSWSRLGAKCTGVDFSDEAINIAKELNRELNLDASFLCCNIYDLKEFLMEKFDIVFTSYGVLGWLPDLDKWAGIVADYLKPGGMFFIAEFHPVLWMFDDNFERIKYDYQNNGVIEVETTGSYAAPDANIRQKEYGWNHSLEEVIMALISHGLIIEAFHELPYSYYNCFNNTIKGEDGYYRIKGLESKIPMMYSIKARKNLK